MCFRLCCDCNRERDGEDDRIMARGEVLASASTRMDRFPYQVAAAAEAASADDDENDDAATAELVLDSDDHSRQDCCRNTSAHEDGELQRGIYQFFRSLRSKFRTYDSLESLAAHDPLNNKPLKRLSLRPALSFDSSTKGVLTISIDEVVMPGSDIQKEMSKLMAASMESYDDECVICMETFDPSNPRMPTFCGCGANRTYFHLPCLYQWVEQNQDCPSCRQKLTWEEF